MGNPLISQSFQQKVDYNINVSLDDEKHMLNGKIQLTYHNHSGKELTFLYFHLWPNAYKDPNTPFAKQKRQNGNLDFLYAKESDRGFIDSLSFTSKGTALKWEIEKNAPDIALIFLTKPLLPGDSVEIQTPFRVKIPGDFSRMGRTGQTYQISQWYPKPAVYDENGWHPMSYLDQGEFYSEFGSFHVEINLPSNYLVAASGTLIAPNEEVDFLKVRSGDTTSLKEPGFFNRISSSNRKNLIFEGSRIHDFAWFASKSVIPLHDTCFIQGNGIVDIWTFSSPRNYNTWKNAPFYTKQALLHYSQLVGAYPYKNMSVVEGPLTAGGGMEYPMFTVISPTTNPKMLDITISHEVGHNWFYGILANNERDQPWLDEGINSYYEDLYTLTRYPNSKLLGNFAYTGLARFLDLNDYPDYAQRELLYQFLARQFEDQASGLNSEKFTQPNYGASLYGKTALSIAHLASFLNHKREGLFDSIMKNYFSEYAFHHCNETLFIQYFEAQSGENLTWFRDELIRQNPQVNYAFTRAHKNKDNTITFTIKNLAKSQIPFSVGYNPSLYSPSTATHLFWSPGFKGSQNITLPDTFTQNLRIDPSFSLPEYNRNNNIAFLNKRGSLTLRRPVRFQFLGSLDHPDKDQIYFMPVISWNMADKTQVGLAVYNSFIPPKNLELAAILALGTGSLRPNALLHFVYHIKTKKQSDLSLGLRFKTSSYGDFFDEKKQKTGYLEYYRWNPFLSFQYQIGSMRSTTYFELTAQAHLVYQANENLFDRGNKVYFFYNTNDLLLRLRDYDALRPYSVSLNLQQCKDFATLSGEVTFDFSFDKRKDQIHFRLFAGGFLKYTNPEIDLEKGIVPPYRYLMLSNSPLTANFTGSFNEDFTYSSMYLDRAGVTKVLSHQVFTNREGGFRSVLPAGIGNTNKWLVTLNISSDLPKRIPVKPFANIGFGYLFDEKSSGFKHGVFVAEAGLSLVGYKDIFEIHFPLLSTKNLRNAQSSLLGLDRFYERITFTLDLNFLNPYKITRGIRF